MAQLSPRQRQHLKGLAHHLKPVVQLGKEGLSPAVVRQVDEALLRHELIKVRLGDSAPPRADVSERLPPEVGAFHVQTIGKVVVLYRPHPEKPRIQLPWDRTEQTVTEPTGDIRRPRARPAGTLPRSVRERGPRLPDKK